MIDPEIQLAIDHAIRTHIHDGNFAQRVNAPDLFLYTFPVQVPSATIATTGSTLAYMLAPHDMALYQVDFSAGQGLTASDTNYITWTIENLGQAGLTNTAMLAVTDVNTTKATGGSSIAADVMRSFVINGTTNNMLVKKGDRLKIIATVTGTLANSVAFPNYLLSFQ